MAKKDQLPASKEDARRRIEEDTQKFLDSGGEIENVMRGKSGMNPAAPGTKQIKLGRTPSTKA